MTASRPNLLFVFTDQQTLRAMSAWGGRDLATPHLDGLAAGGTMFSRSYCALPLCSPSRASLVTGLLPHSSGVTTNHMHLPEGIPHLGGIFRAAGYETAWAGKWHVPEEYPVNGEAIPGFDNLPLPGRATDRDGYPVRLAGKPDHWLHNIGAYVDDPVADVSAEFLRKAHAKPFLLAVSLMNPHDICFPEVYDRAGPVDDARLPPLPANFLPAADEPGFLARTRDTHEGMAKAAAGWDERQWRTARWIYYRFTELADRAVGTILTALREAGREGDTVVVFTSDHGEGLGSHRWLGKLSFHEEPMAVPFIVRWPGRVPAGRIDADRLVSGVDVVPTLCGFAGIAPPPGLDGMDVGPLLRDPALPGRPYVVAEIHPVWKGDTASGRMLRTPGWKYAAFGTDDNPEMLFDLDRDPGETRNLARAPEAREELRRHRGLLREWCDRSGDGFRLP